MVKYHVCNLFTNVSANMRQKVRKREEKENKYSKLFTIGESR
jgi:hypothetical protein